MGIHNEDPKTSISKAKNLDEISDFWDNHSLADYWDETREVTFEVRAQRRRRITIDPDIYSQLETKAHLKGLSPETLVNLWLKERLEEKEAV